MNTAYENKYSLDEYDATASIKCPACDKVYTVLAEEDRDCPHCEGSTTNCDYGIFKTELKKKAPVLRLVKAPRKEIDDINVLLRTVGKAIFVEYVSACRKEFKASEIANDMTDKHSDINYSSALNRVCTIRRIIETGKTIEALNVIVKSKRLKIEIIKHAKTLLITCK